MTTETENRVSLPDLREVDRLLLAAGLARLSEDMTERHPLLSRINSVRKSLEAGTILSERPPHVTFNEPDLQEFLSFLGTSDAWTVYWSGSDDGEGFKLVGTTENDGYASRFDLAEGLKGTEAFVLAEEDHAFAERLRMYVRMWAPSTSDELKVLQIELPISWTAYHGIGGFPDEIAEYFLKLVIADADIGAISTRGLHCDVSSNPSLADAGYAGLRTLAIGTRRQIEALPDVLAAYEAVLTPQSSTPSN